MRHFALLPRFAGRLIHDCLSAYLELKCLHGLCNAHLLRELTFLNEVLRQKWAERMLHLLLRMHRSVAACQARAGPSASPQLAAWTKKYRAILCEGFAENPEPQSPTGRRGRAKRPGPAFTVQAPDATDEPEAGVLAQPGAAVRGLRHPGFRIFPSTRGPRAPVAEGQWFTRPSRASQASRAKQAGSLASG
ncbi:MAG: transposase [Pseudomonadota bacterium]